MTLSGALSGANRTFLFLQGPHGPFFYRLGRMLSAAGADVWRVGFNKGDDAFWFSNTTYLPYLGTHDDWPDRFAEIVAEKGVTDLVLYGDTRPIHAQAIERARDMGVQVHVFEEGYLRPYWVSYERGGANGHSRLMDMSVNEMRAALEGLDLDLPDAPARWGDMRQHMFYGMVYHYFVFLRNWKYRNFKPHRAIGVTKEFQLYLKRLMTLPVTALERGLATWRIKHGGFPYHLALLQLEHDASFQQHSPFQTMTDFLQVTIEGFAKGAPAHHHLVLKAHPLEDGRVPLRREIKRIAKGLGVKDRVHYVRGGNGALGGHGELHGRPAGAVARAAFEGVWRRGV